MAAPSPTAKASTMATTDTYSVAAMKLKMPKAVSPV